VDEVGFGAVIDEGRDVGGVDGLAMGSKERMDEDRDVFLPAKDRLRERPDWAG